MIDANMIPKPVAKAVYDLFEPGYLESIGVKPKSIAAAVLNAWPNMITGPEGIFLPRTLPLSKEGE